MSDNYNRRKVSAILPSEPAAISAPPGVQPGGVFSSTRDEYVRAGLIKPSGTVPQTVSPLANAHSAAHAAPVFDDARKLRGKSRFLRRHLRK